MNAIKYVRSKSGPASLSLGKGTSLTSDMLYKFLRLRFLGGLATPEDEDGVESLFSVTNLGTGSRDCGWFGTRDRGERCNDH